MNFEPQKFFVGLMDFFSILLPGALVTFLLMDRFGPAALGSRVYYSLSDSEGWAVFFFSSYLLGNILFLIGSLLDEAYDWLRSRTEPAQIRLLARRGRALPWPVRAFIRFAFKRERNIAVDRAAKLRARALAPLRAGSAVNTFQWCKAWLAAESPESLATVQRFEASSKFFRCFVVVLALMLAFWPWLTPWPAAPLPIILTVVVLVLALIRYIEQRHKSTNQAYWAVITLMAREGKISLSEPVIPAGEPARAGGVVFKDGWGGVKYLLVEAKDDPNQWVLPKGHREGDESFKETAIREVLEETGVFARVLDLLQDSVYEVNGALVTVRFFLMQRAGSGWRSDADRRHEWLPIEKAFARASHLETRELLRVAEQRRVRGSSVNKQNPVVAFPISSTANNPMRL